MTWAAAIGAALVLGVGVPWLGIRMIVPVLADSPHVANYRGRHVFHGLGIAWLLWAGAAIIGGVAISRILSWPAFADGTEGSVTAVLTLAGPLALVAFALGLVDDTYGSSDARGFHGHLGALMHGRLSTGMLKLIGMSVASLVVGLVLSDVAPWTATTGDTVPARLSMALVAGAAIALTSNFVNLMDLRPGRALKVYSVLGLFGVVSTAIVMPSLTMADPTPSATLGARAIDAVVLALFVFGPVIAVWRDDLGERGMLGDAGANPMGAVAGMLIVIGLPLWGLAAYLVLMLALNLVSERVSFSRVIENNTVLRWLDGLGRIPAEDSLASPAD